MKGITKRIESIKKRTTNGENETRDQGIKVKFHATDEISRHGDLMEK